jgi:hypothetical protein
MEVVALVVAGGAVLTFAFVVVLVFWAAWRGRLTIGPVRVSDAAAGYCLRLPERTTGPGTFGLRWVSRVTTSLE